MALKNKNKSKTKTAVKKAVKASGKKVTKIAAKAKNQKPAAKKQEVKKQSSKPAPAAKPKTVQAVKANVKEKEVKKEKIAAVANEPQKKASIPTGPSYVEADKNGPKNKVKTILISQPKPETEKSPYLDIAHKYNVKIDFRQFIQVEGVPARDFRQQRVNLTEHHAVILTSRIAIDHYFRMCNEMRYTVPETTKYFCLSESIAYYLQKYVQYRKRKIFFGHQTIADLVDVIKKHREEKFLLPVSDIHKEQIVYFLDDLKIQYTKATFYRTVSADLSDFKGKLDYDVVVFFTPAGIRSLFKNFPGFKQGDIRIGAFGATTVKAVREHKLRLDIAAPNPQAPSMTMALEQYIRDVNKR